MRSRVMSMMVIACAACAPSAPATGPAPQADAPPVRALLSERDRLSLSTEQVVALDSLSREMDATDGAVSRRLGVIKGGLVPRLGLAGKPREGLAEVAMKQNEAVRAVERLLRPDQRRRLCELYLERQGKVALRDDKRALTHVDGRGGKRSLASSGARRTEARTWPWCSEPSGSPRTTQSRS